MSSSSAVSSAAKRLGRRRLSIRARRAMWGYLFISPWLIGFLFLWVGATLSSLYFSFTDYSVLSPPRWIGVANYVKMFTNDRLFWLSVANTAYYICLNVPLQILVGFILALLLNMKVRGMTVFRTIYYLPSVVPIVATAGVWVFLLNPRIGLVNFFLRLLHLPAPNWFQSTVWSKPALIFMGLWGVGGGMVIFLAGLQGIPEHLYEAAEIDGANAWQKLVHVTIPMMTPTIFYNLITGLIASSQVFTQAYVTTRGGPLNSTYFYLLKLYEHAFSYLQMGYASAMAWILLLVILGLTIVLFKTARTWVYYEVEAGGRR